MHSLAIKKKTASRYAALILLLFCICIQGCATRQSLPQMNVNYYPQCYKPFKDLEATENYVAKQTAAGAVIGGLLGGGLGALSGNWKAAVAAGAGGVILGGISGYAKAKMQQIKDDKARFASYQADMNQDMMNATRVEQYSLAAMQCYAREFDSLLVQYKYGRITKLDAENRYKEIREGMAQISTILSRSKVDLLKRDEEYRAAFAAEAKAKNMTAPVTATLDTKRASRPVRSRANRNVSGKRSRRTPLQSVPEASSGELTALTNEIQSQKAEADSRTGRIAQASAMTAQTPPQNLDAVSHYYENEGMESVMRIEQAQDMRERTLTAMSNAAANAGIDVI